MSFQALVFILPWNFYVTQSSVALQYRILLSVLWRQALGKDHAIISWKTIFLHAGLCFPIEKLFIKTGCG